MGTEVLKIKIKKKNVALRKKERPRERKKYGN